VKVSKPVLIFGVVILLIAGYIQFFTGKKKPKDLVPAAVQTQAQPAGQTGAPAKPGQAAQANAPQQQAQAPQAQAPQQSNQQTPAKPGDAAPAQAQPKPRFDKIKVGWGSDPFALPVFKEKRRKDAGSAVRLFAILEKGRDRVAVIDKDVVKKGDLIGNEKVIEIGTDRVVLTRGGIKRTLVLTNPDTMTQEPRPAQEELPAKEKATERAK